MAAVLLGWLFNVFVGRFLTAKISTWPVLNRWKILSPQAPIVINNRQTVRVSDSGDIAAAVNDVKSKISSIAFVSASSTSFSGTAINLTSDGGFVTTAASFKTKNPGAYYIVLSDGSFAKISQQTVDPATALVFFKAALSNVPAANLASSKDLSVGDKILLGENSLQKFYVKAQVGNISFSQKDIEGQTFLSDFPSRSFGASANSSLATGQVLVNTSGDVAGLFSDGSIISSDVIKQAMSVYFNNAQKIHRPSFGFSYSIITQTDSGLTGLPEGAMVTEVGANSPARSAGLTVNDVIMLVNGQTVNEASPLEEMLQQYKPGDQISLAVTRKNQTINLSLTVGELK